MRTTTDLSTAAWRKSTYSNTNGGECIEVADGIPGVIPVRDSKDPEGPALRFSHDAWSSFIAGIQAAEFPAT
ncbi:MULTISPECIES: DUF397 domain-containing protein [unclassified Streptomyces]|uniref:DUF397 domain-containing protein n=1 Tax=unclassified Streptomyces TaxID=2593676 RepID=UPI0013C65C80|nr:MULTISPECIES: DUF397 domain-containing protein [unclassified Streptomyces]MCZ4095680.1 DUF397 domain-containing protein [Streptomyces sp. H39-C1]NEA72173.1 DUF397 domain-containing protein [Streptomyces sp. SID13588]